MRDVLHVFDTRNGTWRDVPLGPGGLPPARFGGRMAAGGGRVYLFGGRLEGSVDTLLPGACCGQRGGAAGLGLVVGRLWGG